MDSSRSRLLRMRRSVLAALVGCTILFKKATILEKRFLRMVSTTGNLDKAKMSEDGDGVCHWKHVHTEKCTLG